MTEDLRYPIGEFTPPTGTSAAARRASIAVIAELPERIGAAVRGLDDGQLDTPYRDGGWTVRQVVHHVGDSHMNAVMRFRLTLTEDLPTIKTYDEKAWARLVDVRTLPVDASLQLLEGLHRRWVTLLESLDDEQWQRELHHPELPDPVALWWMLAMYDWHSRHHVAHITRLRAREGW